MKEAITTFVYSNRTALKVFLAGSVIGYIYWYYFGCYWGTYPLSSEWWVNCIYGGIVANIIMNLKRNNIN